MGKYQRAMRSQRFEFVRGADERQAGKRGGFYGEQFGEGTLGIESGANCGAALG